MEDSNEIKRGKRGDLAHDGHSYYCSYTHRNKSVYRCKSVRLSEGEPWEVHGYASKRQKLPGAAFCDGRMERHVRGDGESVTRITVPHICGQVAVSVQESGEVLPDAVPPETETLVEVAGRRRDTDPRPYLEVLVPSPEDPSMDYLSLAWMLNYLQNIFTGWSWISGGGRTDRKYAPQKLFSPVVLTVLTRAMGPYVRWVRAKYPKLVCIKYGALKTVARGKAQYERHSYRLHSDYDDTVYTLPPDERPVSLMVALTPFVLLYLPDYHKSYGAIESLHLRENNGVYFTNRCLHSGGANETDEETFRLFAYMTSRASDLPDNRIWLHSDVLPDAKRGTPAEEHSASLTSTTAQGARTYATSRFGRVCAKTDRLSEYNA